MVGIQRRKGEGVIEDVRDGPGEVRREVRGGEGDVRRGGRTVRGNASGKVEVEDGETAFLHSVVRGGEPAVACPQR